MRIGVVGTLWHNTPPTKYGGTEEVVYNLVNGLTEKDHVVTFFGPATANVAARIIPTVPMPLREMDVSWDNVSYTLSHLIEAFNRAKDFDILHVHLNKAQDYIALPFSVYKNTPTLFTIHFRIPDQKYKPDRYLVMKKFTHLPYTTISHSQGRKEFNCIATIYNTLKISNYPFVPNPQDYFVWLGKIMPIKGTKEAILAAKKAKKKLYVLGAIEHSVKAYLEYFTHEVQPLIDNKQIILVENVGLPQKAELLGGAKALLNPILWEEPFGMVMLEAQSCGVPVIAFDRGAARELVIDGKTGYLVHSVEAMVEAMGKIDQIERKACRAHVEEKFSKETMVEGYLRAYKTVIQNWPEYHRKQIDQMKL